MKDADKEIVCQDCGDTFVFTQAEAEFFEKHSLSSPPKRCKPCRVAARSRNRNPQPADRYATGDPNEYRSPMPCDNLPSFRGRQANGNSRDPQSEYRAPSGGRTVGRPRQDAGTAPRGPNNAGRDGYHRGNGARGRPVGARQLFTATCAKCGATAHIPFEPSRGREVLCRTCFNESRGIPSQGQGQGSNESGS